MPSTTLRSATIVQMGSSEESVTAVHARKLIGCMPSDPCFGYLSSELGLSAGALEARSRLDEPYSESFFLIQQILTHDCERTAKRLRLKRRKAKE